MAPQESQDAFDPRKPGAAPALGDPVLERTMAEDPLVKFVQKRWRQIAVVLIVAGVAVWFAHMFRETYRERMRESADAFARVQIEYSQLRSLERQQQQSVKPKEGQKPEDAVKDLEGKITASRDRLAQGLPALVEAEPPYNVIGRIYQDLLERSRGNMGVLKADLAAASWATDKPGSQQRFYNELRALVIARALVDDSANRADGLRALKDLAANGETAYAAAGLALAGLASTPEELTEAQRLLEGILKRAPQQRESIQPELDRVRAALE
jgi:hypothetical protein